MGGDQGPTALARGFDGNALGDGAKLAGTAVGEAVKTVVGGAEPLHLHAVEAHRGRQRLDRGAHAANQPAAAHRHQHGIEALHLLKQFQADRSLPGNHPLVIERMRQRQVALRHQLPGLGHGLIERFAHQQDFRAEHLGVLHLGVGRGARHHDHGGDAQASGVIGDGLGVVACRNRKNAPLPGIGGEARQPVQGPALLEGCRELVVFELEVNLRAQHRRQGLGARARGAQNLSRDALGRRLNGGQLHQLPRLIHDLSHVRFCGHFSPYGGFPCGEDGAAVAILRHRPAIPFSEALSQTPAHRLSHPDRQHRAHGRSCAPRRSLRGR